MNHWDNFSIITASLVAASTFLGSVAFLFRVFLRPILIHIREHDLMWEDYSIKHNLSYRVHLGRGSRVKSASEMGITT